MKFYFHRRNFIFTEFYFSAKTKKDIRKDRRFYPDLHEMPAQMPLSLTIIDAYQQSCQENAGI